MTWLAKLESWSVAVWVWVWTTAKLFSHSDLTESILELKAVSPSIRAEYSDQTLTLPESLPMNPLSEPINSGFTWA